MYDIRHPYNDPTPPTYFTDYLNLPEVQNAIGVSVNYTDANNDVYWYVKLMSGSVLRASIKRQAAL